MRGVRIDGRRASRTELSGFQSRDYQFFVRDGKRKVSVSGSPGLLVYSGGGDGPSGRR